MKLMLRWRPQGVAGRAERWGVKGQWTSVGKDGDRLPGSYAHRQGTRLQHFTHFILAPPRRRPDLRVLADVGYLTVDLVPRPCGVGRRGRV